MVDYESFNPLCVVEGDDQEMSNKLNTIVFVSVFIIIFFVLPLIFPHNIVVYWIRGIFAVLIIFLSIDEYIRKKRKK